MVVFVIEVCPITNKLLFLPLIALFKVFGIFAAVQVRSLMPWKHFQSLTSPIGEDPACPGIRLAIGPRRRYYLSDRSHRYCRPLHPQGSNHQYLHKSIRG
jgi:hypothetical protein